MMRYCRPVVNILNIFGRVILFIVADLATQYVITVVFRKVFEFYYDNCLPRHTMVSILGSSSQICNHILNAIKSMNDLRMSRIERFIQMMVFFVTNSFASWTFNAPPVPAKKVSARASTAASTAVPTSAVPTTIESFERLSDAASIQPPPLSTFDAANDAILESNVLLAAVAAAGMTAMPGVVPVVAPVAAVTAVTAVTAKRSVRKKTSVV